MPSGPGIGCPPVWGASVKVGRVIRHIRGVGSRPPRSAVSSTQLFGPRASSNASVLFLLKFIFRVRN